MAQLHPGAQDSGSSRADELHAATLRPCVSLVVSTRDRCWQLARLFESLETQTLRAFEVLVVDQNPDGRLDALIEGGDWSFPIRHLKMGATAGLSRGRNCGWRRALASIVLFPDDDCWYPPGFLQDGLEKMARMDLDLLCGRAAAADGRSINGRYSRSPRQIDKANVWVCQMEWATFIRRSLLDAVGGYDEALGLGAATPWQAAEGPDLILRALDLGAKCHFDPSLCGFHQEIDTIAPDPSTVRKLWGYGRGMGYVLRKHRYSLAAKIYWCSRPLFNVMRHTIRGRPERSKYYLAVFVGRIEGVLMRVVSTHVQGAPDAGGRPASGRDANDRGRATTEPR